MKNLFGEQEKEEVWEDTKELAEARFNKWLSNCFPEQVVIKRTDSEYKLIEFSAVPIDPWNTK